MSAVNTTPRGLIAIFLILGFCNMAGAAEESKKFLEKFTDQSQGLQAFKENYILLSGFDSNYRTENDVSIFDEGARHDEVKFQVSIRIPLVQNLFNSQGDLYAAYTTRAVWQITNKDWSAPFRDINHEPEAFLLFQPDYQLEHTKLAAWFVGINHQSNGQSSSPIYNTEGEVVVNSLSRSWNRLMIGGVFQQQNFSWSLSSWYRLREKKKSSPTDPRGDDNPDLEDYVGNFKLSFFRAFDRSRVSATIHHNLDSSTPRGSVELTWNRSLTRHLGFMVQYFDGYGESLVDYSSHNRRIGIGISLNAF